MWTETSVWSDTTTAVLARIETYGYTHAHKKAKDWKHYNNNNNNVGKLYNISQPSDPTQPSIPPGSVIEW